MTSHHYSETAAPDAIKRYPSDLNDQEFDLVAPHVHKTPGMARNALSISVKS